MSRQDQDLRHPAAGACVTVVRRDPFLTSRRLALGAVVFGLFVIFDIVLFGWLIFESLSQREIDKVLFETRAEALPLARRLEAQAESLGQDLWVVVTVAQEQTTYLQSFPAQRQIIRRIEILDREGTVVYKEEHVPLADALGVEAGGDELSFEPPVRGLEAVEVPIGELGTIVIGLDQQKLQQRIGGLRRDLIRQTSVIGGLTLALLVAAFLTIWMLFRRAQRLEDQALEAERLAYIGTLASGLAHEIRNPLNSLSLNMQMLEEEAGPRGAGGSRERLLSITRSELGRLERLDTDFLSYAKPQPLELEEVPAAELLERALEVMGSEINGRGAVVEIDDRSAGCTVRVDPGQIGQLLINLMHNALAAMEKTGRSPVVRLVARRQGANVVLEVADNGRGVSPEDRERIFDLFYSTRKGGTGLGLAIVQRIAKAHGAALEIDSTPGRGTVMRLTLAAAGAPRPVPEKMYGKISG